MARGRFLSKSLSTSRKFADLHQIAGPFAEFCQTVYCLLVTHTDDFGRFDGDPFTIKHEVVPTSPRTITEVASALAYLHQVNLIVWYDGLRRNTDRTQKIVQVVLHDEHQPGLHKRVISWFEAPGSSGNFREVPGSSGRKREDRRSKREERREKQDPSKNRDPARSKRDPHASKDHRAPRGAHTNGALRALALSTYQPGLLMSENTARVKDAARKAQLPFTAPQIHSLMSMVERMKQKGHDG